MLFLETIPVCYESHNKQTHRAAHRRRLLLPLITGSYVRARNILEAKMYKSTLRIAKAACIRFK